jgi:hypothetical protein
MDRIGSIRNPSDRIKINISLSEFNRIELGWEQK